MKKITMSVMLAALMAIMVFGSALAAGGGTPDAHGVDGKTFGAVVSSAAQSAPGAIADHPDRRPGRYVAVFRPAPFRGHLLGASRCVGPVASGVGRIVLLPIAGHITVVLG